MIETLKTFGVLAALWAALYAPFHFLDKNASPKARARARAAIKDGKAFSDTRPLGSLFNLVFGNVHLSWRCFLLSAAMTVVFTTIFVGLADRFLFGVADAISDYNSRLDMAEPHLNRALRALVPIQEMLIKAYEGSTDQESLKALAELKAKKAETEGMLKMPLTRGEPILLWMLASVALSGNVLCDYIALWKTRIVMRWIGASKSRLAVPAYLVVDFILGALVWLVAMGIFVAINHDGFMSWSEVAPPLVSDVAAVSLATTLATSFWLYAFVSGTATAGVLGRLLAVVLSGITELIDPGEHAFKVIGIIGATVLFASIVATLLVIR
jgi:hypothetical protein